MTHQASPQRNFSLIAIGLVLLLALALALLTNWAWYWIWLAAINLITFFFYGYDKSSAQRGGWRTPEIVLHGLALAGGFLGGWAGMFAFRHKTRKPLFKVVLAVATILWLILLYYLI